MSRERNTMHWGWVEDSIWRLAYSEWHFLRQLPYALVTSIDSSIDLRSTTTARKIVQREDSCTFLGRALLVPDGAIVEIALRHDLFSHFDEIWLYEHSPRVAKPPGASIVSPVDLSIAAPPRDLLNWFSESDCVVGLGDGIGMNYMTTSTQVAYALTGRQEQPST